MDDSSFSLIADLLILLIANGPKNHGDFLYRYSLRIIKC